MLGVTNLPSIMYDHLSTTSHSLTPVKCSFHLPNSPSTSHDNVCPSLKLTSATSRSFHTNQMFIPSPCGVCVCVCVCVCVRVCVCVCVCVCPKLSSTASGSSHTSQTFIPSPQLSSTTSHSFHYQSNICSLSHTLLHCLLLIPNQSNVHSLSQTHLHPVSLIPYQSNIRPLSQTHLSLIPHSGLLEYKPAPTDTSIKNHFYKMNRDIGMANYDKQVKQESHTPPSLYLCFVIGA